MLLLVYIFIFFISCLIGIKKNKFLGANFIFLLFLLSSLTSIFLLNTDNDFVTFNEDRLSLKAIIYHIICIYIFVFPIIAFERKANINFEEINKKALKYISLFLIISSFLSIVRSLYIIKDFEIYDITSFTEIRRDIVTEGNRIYLDWGLLDYISIGRYLSVFSIFCAFYYLLILDNKKMFYYLIFSSTSIIFANLTSMGRDGIIRWILYFVLNLIVFKKYKLINGYRLLYKLLFLFGVFGVFSFLIISFSRFSERGSVFDSLLYYFGQSFIYFSYIYERFIDGTYFGELTFPYLFPQDNYLRSLLSADFNLNTFSTFVGSFFMDFGIIYTFLLICFSSVLFYIIIIPRKNNKISLNKLFVYLFLCQFLLDGLFYYFYTSRTAVLAIIFFMIYSYFISYLYPSRKI